MTKKMICIACPIGCQLAVEIDGSRVIDVRGNKCEKGPAYARQEVENPTRMFTSTVLAEGLELKMVPVRTSTPIPKNKLLPAMEEIKKIRITNPVKIGDVIKEDFLGLKTKLIATRGVLK